MTSDAEARLYAAERKAQEADTFFQRFASHPWDDVERFVGMAIRDPSTQDNAFDFVEEGRKCYPKPSAMPALKRYLWKAFRASMETDPLSAMAATIIPGEKVPFSWKVFETDPLTANFSEGRFGFISGPPRQGKTNTGCVLLERAKTHEFMPFSNIKLDVPGYMHTPDAVSVIREGIACARAKKRWLFVLDEGAASGLVRQQWYTKRSRDLNVFIKTPMGKLRGNMVLIEQDPNAVPPLIMQWATSRFHCPRERWVSIDLRGPELVWREDVRDFPKSSLPFETRDMAIFDVNVDIEAMLRVTAGAEDQLQAMLDFIETPKAKTPHLKGPRERDSEGRFA